MKIFYGFLISFSLAFFVSADLEAGMGQGIDDGDTQALKAYINSDPDRTKRFIDEVLKKTILRSGINGIPFNCSKQNLPLKNYEVLTSILRVKCSAHVTSADFAEGSLGLARLLAERGFFPVTSLVGGHNDTLEDFRGEVLTALKDVIEHSSSQCWKFHACLWRAIVHMDGYQKGVWGAQNPPLGLAWEDLLVARTLRDERNFSRSVYLFKALALAVKNHRPLVVPAGQDVEVYHKSKAQEWFDFYRDVQSRVGQAAPLIQNVLGAIAVMAPVVPPVAAAPAAVAMAAVLPVNSGMKNSAVRTSYMRENQQVEAEVRDALKDWQPVVAPAVAAAAPAHGFSDSEDEGDNGQGPAEAMDEEQDDSESSSGSAPESEDQDEGDNGQGPLEDIDGIEGMMNEEPDSGPEESWSGAVGMNHPQYSETDEEVSPSKKGKGKRMIESSDEEEDHEGSSSSTSGPVQKKKRNFLDKKARAKRDAEIVELRSQQKSYSEIIRQMEPEYPSIDKHIVSDVLKKANLTSTMENPRMSPADYKAKKQEVFDIYEAMLASGETLSRSGIDTKTGLSKRQVDRIVAAYRKEHNLNPEPKARGEEEKRAKRKPILDMYQQQIADGGKPNYNTISLATGLKEQYVARVITESKKEGKIQTYIDVLTSDQKKILKTFIRMHETKSNQNIADLFNTQKIQGMPKITNIRVANIRRWWKKNKS